MRVGARAHVRTLYNVLCAVLVGAAVFLQFVQLINVVRSIGIGLKINHYISREDN